MISLLETHLRFGRGAQSTGPSTWRAIGLLATISSAALGFASGDFLAPGSSAAKTLLRPATYAFAISLPVYASLIAYGSSALRADQRALRMHDRLVPWLVATNLLGLFGNLASRHGWSTASALALLGQLLASVVLFQIANVHVQMQRLNPLWRVPFSLFLGWLFVKALAHVGPVLAPLGGEGLPNSLFWPTLVLAALGATSWFIAAEAEEGIVSAVLAWACVAISIENFRFGSVFVGAVALFVGLGSGLIALATESQRDWRRFTLLIKTRSALLAAKRPHVGAPARDASRSPELARADIGE
ncbi:MAG TPA: hypothetical protein VFQ61_10205 [Polyangiaceae bacterium]|nr:hypothetical protein [Polyangiaceae bacterium]